MNAPVQMPQQAQGKGRGGNADWQGKVRGGVGVIGFFGTLIPSSRLAAMLTWLGAVLTTYILFNSISNGEIWNGQLTWQMFFNLWGPVGIFAVVYQFVITVLQRGYWSGDKSSLATGAMVVETITNAAAIFPYMLNLDVSGIWYMLQTTFEFWPEFNRLAAFAASAIIGYVMAGAPEYLWNSKK